MAGSKDIIFGSNLHCTEKGWDVPRPLSKVRWNWELNVALLLSRSVSLLRSHLWEHCATKQFKLAAAGWLVSSKTHPKQDTAWIITQKMYGTSRFHCFKSCIFIFLVLPFKFMVGYWSDRQEYLWSFCSFFKYLSLHSLLRRISGYTSVECFGYLLQKKNQQKKTPTQHTPVGKIIKWQAHLPGPITSRRHG